MQRVLQKKSSSDSGMRGYRELPVEELYLYRVLVLSSTTVDKYLVEVQAKVHVQAKV